MGKRIYKYEVPGAIHAQVGQWLQPHMQNGKLCIWAEIDDTAPEREWIVTFVGTGWELDATIPDYAQYCGTVMDGAFVWHVFAFEAPEAEWDEEHTLVHY